jgi:hypothetical protein
LALPFFGLLAAVSAFSPAATAQDGDTLRTLYSEFLTEEGYRPTVDQDGDVVFKHEGKTYFIDVHEKDPSFFMIVLPNIWPIESAEERIQVLVAADVANREVMSAKVATKGDNVWVTLEMFVKSPADFQGIFDRALSAIGTATDTFAAKMRE